QNQASAYGPQPPLRLSTPRSGTRIRARRDSLEIVFEAELHAAGSNLRAADDTEVTRAVADRRIAEHRVIANVRSFQAELDTLALLRTPTLQQRGVQRIDLRAAHVQRARSGAQCIRCGSREGGLIEVIRQAV